MSTDPLLQNVDTSKSVETHEGVVWKPPVLQSYVAKTCFALRRKPLHDLTNEELRVGLEQQVGVTFLIPLAIKRLEADPLLEARLYEGDLLQSLLDVPFDYWRRHPDLQRKAGCIATAALQQAASCSASWRDEVLPGIREAHDRFTGKLEARTWLRPERE